MIERLMDNPYAWLVLSLCSIVSLAFAIYTWIVGRKTKEISIDYSFNEIIKQKENPVSRLVIEFDGKRIENLIVTTLYLWNSGNDVINCSDVVGENIQIKCSKNSILSAKIIFQNESTNNFAIKNFTSKEIDIHFDYVDKGEGVKIQMLHTETNDEFAFGCKIKGGRDLRICQKINRQKNIYDFLKLIAQPILFYFVLILDIYFISTIKKCFGFSDNIMVVPFYGILLVSTFAYIMVRKIYNQAFNRNIPDTLRKN